MGVASGGCQGRGETGAGAAAAVATGKESSGEVRSKGREGEIQGSVWLEKTR